MIKQKTSTNSTRGCDDPVRDEEQSKWVEQELEDESEPEMGTFM
jgi:hypothetical protein